MIAEKAQLKKTINTFIKDKFKVSIPLSIHGWDKALMGILNLNTTMDADTHDGVR